MDWTQIQQHWTAAIPRIMTRWPETEEDALLDVDGSEDAFYIYLAQVTGQPVDEARRDAAEWMRGEQPADMVMDPSMDNERISASSAHIPPGEDASDDDAAFGDDGTSEPPVGRSR